MIVAAHHPNYLPWMGYFSKILESDVFVIMDTVQFTKNGYQNRVNIKTKGGPLWLTQPVALSGKSFPETRLVGFANKKWGEKHTKTLRGNYARSPYFATYFNELSDLITNAPSMLAECNERLIKWVCQVLAVTTPLVRTSDLFVDNYSDATDRIIALVQAAGGDTYLSGSGAFGYMDVERIQAAGIRVVKSKDSFPAYPQLWGPYVAGLSIVDLLMNCGEQSASILAGQTAV